MRILVGCEESQKVTKAFRDRGHDAYSCDLIPTRGNPEWHIQGCVIDAIKNHGPWDLIILHPPCTALCVSGNRWYGQGMEKYRERLTAIGWTVSLWVIAKKHCKHVALENPVSVIFKHLSAYVQYIQPYDFGHGETKNTGFALHNLPPLEATNKVEGRKARIHKMPPSDTRARDRSETYQGIADAIAEQWGNAVNFQKRQLELFN